MKRALLACLFCLALTGVPRAASLQLSAGPVHYAREMEFYYQKPRREMIAPMLAAMSRAGQLANAAKRMFIAAFLAALMDKGAVSLADLAAQAKDRDARLTLAWAAHLCASPRERELASSLLDAKDFVAAEQIRRSPSPLSAWNPAWEKSVLNMYWAAFMATGDEIWLQRIIKTAFGYARGLKGSGAAAASLYEYAPRHAKICECLKQALPLARDSEKEIITTILRHANQN